jgi:hypothetical protein
LYRYLEEVINNIDVKFPAFCTMDDEGGGLSFAGFSEMLTEVDNGLRALPATVGGLHKLNAVHPYTGSSRSRDSNCRPSDSR